MDDSRIAVAYFGDETDFRKKKCGLSLIEQLFLSVSSIRNNWSNDVDVFFFHSTSLSSNTVNELKLLRVNVRQCFSVIEPEFPLSNKILVGSLYGGGKNLLFLDCDTIVHKPIDVKLDTPMYVAYDVLRNIDKDDYIKISDYLKIELQPREIFESPAFEYYYNNVINQFPVFNSGVFYLRNDLQHTFYNEYKNVFTALYSKFKNERWRFYIEQIAFCMAIVKLKINYAIFPKGYNFICTPRANYLKDWNTDTIIIEHYAGDNGRPMSSTE